MGGIIISKLGSQIGAMIVGRAYWAFKRRDDTWLCELDPHYDIRNARMGELQWWDDVVQNGDCLNIKELWLFCPPNPGHPLGQTARLDIKESGTAFMHRGTSLVVSQDRGNSKQSTYLCIGRVDNKETGLSTCFIWDSLVQTLFKGENTVPDFQPWRPGCSPVGRLSLDVIGIRL